MRPAPFLLFAALSCRDKAEGGGDEGGGHEGRPHGDGEDSPGGPDSGSPLLAWTATVTRDWPLELAMERGWTLTESVMARETLEIDPRAPGACTAAPAESPRDQRPKLRSFA